MSPAFIPSPSTSGFHIGPLFLHAYGIAYVFAVTAAILIARRRWEKLGGSRQMVYECAVWGFAAGLRGDGHLRAGRAGGTDIEGVGCDGDVGNGFRRERAQPGRGAIVRKRGRAALLAVRRESARHHLGDRGN